MPDGTTVAFADSGGPGPAVVLLHGLAGSGREWLPTAEHLTGVRLLVLDQRGHGRSTRRPVDTAAEAFVDDAVRVVESAGAAPVTLVGQSMGARVALLAAAARPDLVARLVLLEGGVGGEDPEGGASTADLLRSWPLPFPDLASARRFLGDGPLARTWADDLELGPDGLRPRFDAEVMVRILDDLAEPRWDEWERVAVPTLAVFAERGMFSASQQAELVRRGRSVRRVELAGAGHDAHLEVPDVWAAVVRGFLPV